MNAPDELTFSWPDSRHVELALPGFIALSLFLHALTFYIFQIGYPPSVHVAPPPAQVSLLAATTPENEALLRWIAAEDPASAAMAPEVAPENLLDVPYHPSFAEIRAQPKLAPEPKANFSYPPALPPLAMIESALPRPSAATSAPVRQQTAIDFSDNLEHRVVTKSPAFAIHSHAAELQAARFLVGVSDRGQVRYVFLQSSSGDKLVDEQAEKALCQMEFAHVDEPLTWSMATFSWGASVLEKVPPKK